ncbi:MAG: hypothetical protein U5M50_03900 [Sphingobium sp.]|nr:hypothetical protein [Sphingobium sp.]
MNVLLARLRSRVIDQWRLGWRLWSVRLHAAALALAALFAAAPQAVLELWAMLPVEAKAAIPPHFARWIPVLLGAAGIAARFVKQKGVGDGK